MTATAGNRATRTKHPLIITEEQLQAMSGYTRRSELRLWLLRNRIWFTEGKDGLLATTVSAVDRACTPPADDSEVEFA